MGDKTISELAGVEFTGSLGEAFKTYADELEALARRWKFELDIAASDSEAAMKAMHKSWYLFGLDTLAVRARARRVAKRLKRAQDLAHGLAAEGRAFDRAYRRHFLDAVGPSRPVTVGKAEK